MAMEHFAFWAKIAAIALFGLLNIYLFVISCGISYQHAMAQEQVRFREQMPTMDSWKNSPFGKLKSYLFNVTNAEEFLSGKDAKVKLEQIGPIVYNIVGYNDIINRTEDSISYRKFRYRRVEFVPEESVSPDILNKTIVQFNSVLIGAAAKYAHMPYVSLAFNALTLGEKVFMSGTVYYYLWEFTRPGLVLFSRVMPISTNCGTLFNALKEKDEVFTVNIGNKHGLEKFFGIQNLNNKTLIEERAKLMSRMDQDEIDSCPINVTGTLDNSLYPPFLTRDTPLNVLASESCRVLPLRYQRDQQHDGLNAYRYTLLQANESAPRCMDTTYSVKLPRGMFDVSPCVINDAPSAFSMPHFYGSSYDWRQHFEGLNPNAAEHEPFILLEPTMGIPINEKYRFQSNTPLPDFSRFSQKLKKLSNMVVPGFWYEFDMDHLPDFILQMMHFNVYWMPTVQRVLMTLQLLLAMWCLASVVKRCNRCESYRELYHKICGRSNVQLETVLNPQPQHECKPSVELALK